MDSSTIFPPGNRRTKEELIIKLFIVHFTSIAIYGHLIGIRNEKRLNWRSFIFALTTSAILFQLAVALLAIFVNFVFKLAQNLKVPDLEAELLRPLRFLLGKIRDENSKYERLPGMLLIAINVPENRSVFLTFSKDLCNGFHCWSLFLAN